MEIDTDSTQYIMKNIAWMLMFVLVGCHHTEPVLPVNPSQLIGTWNTKSISTSEIPYIRQTFESDYVYTIGDTLKTCQPVNNASFYRYWVEGDILVTRYEGITNGFPDPDTRRHIVSLTSTELVLDTPHQVLEKCP